MNVWNKVNGNLSSSWDIQVCTKVANCPTDITNPNTLLTKLKLPHSHSFFRCVIILHSCKSSATYWTARKTHLRLYATIRTPCGTHFDPEVLVSTWLHPEQQKKRYCFLIFIDSDPHVIVHFKINWPWSQFWETSHEGGFFCLSIVYSIEAQLIVKYWPNASWFIAHHV